MAFAGQAASLAASNKVVARHMDQDASQKWIFSEEQLRSVPSIKDGLTTAEVGFILLSVFSDFSISVISWSFCLFKSSLLFYLFFF